MKDQIRELLKEIQPNYDFEDGVDFIEEGYLDSFDIVQLVSELEKIYNINISALYVIPENFCSVASIEKLINNINSNK